MTRQLVFQSFCDLFHNMFDECNSNRRENLELGVQRIVLTPVLTVAHKSSPVVVDTDDIRKVASCGRGACVCKIVERIYLS